MITFTIISNRQTFNRNIWQDRRRRDARSFRQVQITHTLTKRIRNLQRREQRITWRRSTQPLHKLLVLSPLFSIQLSWGLQIQLLIHLFDGPKLVNILQ